MLILSLFPGIDLFGTAFENEGCCVARGPDLIYGGDICKFFPTRGRFDGIIAGPPCQEFSCARRTAPTGIGVKLLEETARVIVQAAPEWFVIENVPACPDVVIAGYSHQRLDLYASDFGLPQRRLRHFQFGHRGGKTLVISRGPREAVTMPAALASEGERGKGRRDWAAFCALQGLPALELPGMTLAARYRAVGNGVPIPMGRAIARAVLALEQQPEMVWACSCGCGRPVTGRRTLARGACRQRMLRRRRESHPSIVRGPGLVTPAQ